MLNSIYKFSAKDIDGNMLDFSTLKGKVLLIVNTASKCGFTKQYAELEQLYKKYQDKGLEIIAFPCNQFGNQEPGNLDEIKQFCSLNYDVTFKLMEKIDVNGVNTHPIYQFLKKEARGIFFTQRIKWNFTKFLIDTNGVVIKRYSPQCKPLQLESIIKKLLA